MSLNDSMTPQERAQLAVWDYPVSDKYTSIWRYMKDAGLPKNTEDAINRVFMHDPGTKQEFAYVGDATEIKYAVITNCSFRPVGKEFSRKPYAIAVQQGSPLKDSISSAILKLLNQRDLERLKEDWWTKNPNRLQCPKDEDASAGISIKNIAISLQDQTQLVCKYKTRYYRGVYDRRCCNINGCDPNWKTWSILAILDVDVKRCKKCLFIDEV